MSRSLKIEKKNKGNEIKEKNAKISLKNISKTKIFLTLILLIISILFFICLNQNNSNEFISKYFLKTEKQKVKAADINITPEDLQIGEACYVSSSEIILRETGTGPFDSNNEPGNDKDAENDIVRSFDQISWTVENTLSLKDLQSDTSYTGGILQVKAELPEAVKGKAKWDLDSMIWAENAEIIDDRIFVAYYSLSTEQISIPGKQNIEFILKVLGAPNGLEIQPTFTVNIVGNEENEKVNVTDNQAVIVSAAPALNIEIKRNSRLNYKSYFDYNSGDESLSSNENTIFGRMSGYSLILQLYNNDANKQLKGIEIPKGDITFDLEFGEFKGPRNQLENITENDGYTPLLWEYKENLNNGKTGKTGKNMEWSGLDFTAYGFTIAPFNSGNNEQSCYNGGNWQIIQDSEKPYLYHVTVQNYEFEENFKFPTSNGSSIRYGNNVGCFSAGYLQGILQFPENLAATTLYMNVEVSNINYRTISNVLSTEESKLTDNIITTSIETSSNGSYSKYLLYGDSGYSSINRNGDANACLGFDRGSLYARFTVGTNNDREDWAYGVDYLIKFDDSALELMRTANNKEYTFSTNSVNTQDYIMRFNILYAGKKDKTGWISDEEMQETSMDDLVYFDTLEEINDAGYTCVAVMAESISGYAKSGDEINIKVPYRVKDSAVVGNVYQALNDIRIYNQANIPNRATQTHVLTTDKENFPQFKWNAENEQYVKSEYDNAGNVLPGTHHPGGNTGNSLLIIGAKQSITIKTIDENNNDKTNYDIGRNENIVKIKINPAINVDTSAIIENITIKVEATIEEGLNYVFGTSNCGEPEIVNNSDGSTTLIWYKTGCTANEPIDPIIFDAHISEDTSHGKQYNIETFMSEYVEDGNLPKIGNPYSNNRYASTTIQITNLTSYALYKNTEDPIIEVNSKGKFTLSALNKTIYDLNTFQLLDILPYNGDNRGTNYNGDYTVEKITILNRDSSGNPIENNNIKLYITDNINARNGVTVKDEGLGTTEMWREATSGDDINSEITAIALTGKLPAKSVLEIEIEIKTNGNKPQDKYCNQTTAQINPETEEIQSSIVKIEVIKRILDGKIWLDSNLNGIIDDNEAYLKDVILELINEDGTKAKDIYGNEIPEKNTDNNGYYKFEDMQAGRYKVVVKFDDIYELTSKNIGSNFKINSKFNSDGKTDVITKFETLENTLIKQEFINAGLIRSNGKVIVDHFIEGTTTPIVLSNGELAEEEILRGSLGVEYHTSMANHADYYELVAIPDNHEGNFTEENIHVIYYYRLKQYPYIVNYYDKETGKKIKTTKIVEGNDYGTQIFSNDEIIDIDDYEYYSSDKESLFITSNESENVINLYYIKKMGKVIVEYIDIDTGEEIYETIETTQKVGNKYTTEQKEIDGYAFVKDTNNTSGTYVEGETKVIYYYRKMTFNLKVDKWLESVSLNETQKKRTNL